MLGVGGLSLSFGSGGKGEGGTLGGGHLSNKMLLVDTPFFPRCLQEEREKHLPNLTPLLH